MPKGIVATGFPRVRETCRQIGIGFDPWQQDLNKCLLAKTSDGLLAADTAVISIGRQVGKTFDVGAVIFAECIAEPGTTVIWTAHRFKVSRETFNELRALAKTPKLAPHIDYDAITTAAGNECIPFRNGSRIVFAARERGAIRGFTKVRILILDEAQILTDAQLADLAPTMNQASNPLIILMGTPPKPNDPGEVFANLRSEALAQFKEFGHSEDGVLYVEFSADPDADPDDRGQWRIANPSYPKRTPARSILRLRKLLSPEDFRREALGIWDTDLASSLIDMGAWQDLSSPAAGMVRPTGFAVAVSPDRAWAAVGSAGPAKGDPKKLHVELIERQSGVEWVPEFCVSLQKKHGKIPFVLDDHGPASSLIIELTEVKVKVLALKGGELADATEQFIDGVRAARYTHGPQNEIDDAIRGVKPRPLGDRIVFGRKASTVDITALEVLPLAVWGATRPPPKSRVIDLNAVMREMAADEAKDMASRRDT